MYFGISAQDPEAAQVWVGFEEQRRLSDIVACKGCPDSVVPDGELPPVRLASPVANQAVFPLICNIWAMRRDLLSAIEVPASLCLKTSVLFGADGEPVDDFLAFICREYVTIRGGPASIYHGRCSNCGHPDYAPIPISSAHIMTADLPEGAAILGNRFFAMVVNEEIHNSITKAGIPVYVRPIQILDEPLDMRPRRL